MSASNRFGSGIEPIPEGFPPTWNCFDTQHSPPTMLSIPSGYRYRHVCPSCRLLSYVYPTEALAVIDHHPV